MNLVEFLKARVAEDKLVALLAKHDADGAWWWDAPESNPERHIARHNPDRALREVEAKRDVLARHFRAPLKDWGLGGECEGCGYTGDLDDPRTYREDECPELMSMALAYSDRPDYREDWKP